MLGNAARTGLGSSMILEYESFLFSKAGEVPVGQLDFDVWCEGLQRFRCWMAPYLAK